MTDETEREKESTESADIKFPWKYLIAFGFSILILWVGSPFVLFRLFADWDTVDKFGGGYGAAGALFSGFALAGVVVAILLQRKELELQREELRLTRRELARTAKAQENSEKAFVDQARALDRAARLSALRFLPLLGLKVQLGSENKSHLFLSNDGNTHAFDLDIRILAVYSTKDIEVDEFIRNNVTKSDGRLRNYKEDSAHQFCVSDELFEFSLPIEANLSGKLIVPDRVNKLLILLQCRDAFGSNYSQLYEFLLDRDPNVKRYNLFQLDPIAPQTFPRLSGDLEHGLGEYTGEEIETPYLETPLVTEDNSEVPEHLAEFVFLWSQAIPSEFVTVPYLLDEPRLTLRKPKPRGR